MELELINKLYLELSQITTAKTERELRACNAHEELVAMVKEFIQDYQEMGIGDKQTVQNAQQILTTIEKGA